MIQGKTVLVTGASGFIGSHLTKRLLELHADVHIITRSSTPSTRLTHVQKHITTHTVDICDEKKLTTVVHKIQPDIIFHLANIGVYGGVEGNEKEVTEVNFLGTRNLIKAVGTIPYSLFVNTGSSSEYGPKNQPMHEGDICNPQGIYAITKLAATNYTSWYAKEYNRPLITLRIFSPFGPDDDPRRLISSVIKKAILHEKIEIGNPENVRDYIYIDDVIDAYLSCITHQKKLSGQVINIGSGHQMTVKEVVEKIREMSHSQSNLKQGASIHRHESAVWVADISSAKKILHWRPQHSFEEGLSKTIAWYKENNSSTSLKKR